MSYYEEDDDDEDLFTKMMRLRDMIATVPEQAKLISNEAGKTASQIGREVGRVIPPHQKRVIRQIRQPEVPATPAATVPVTPAAQVPVVVAPRVPKTDAYSRFAGRRRKVPDMFVVFTGRRRKK